MVSLWQHWDLNRMAWPWDSGHRVRQACRGTASLAPALPLAPAHISVVIWNVRYGDTSF